MHKHTTFKLVNPSKFFGKPKTTNKIYQIFIFGLLLTLIYPFSTNINNANGY